jgi:hypothetical protein
MIFIKTLKPFLAFACWVAITQTALQSIATAQTEADIDAILITLIDLPQMENGILNASPLIYLRLPGLK